MEQLIQYDKSLLLFLNGLGNANFDSFWLSITKPIYWTPLFLLFLFWVYKKYQLKGMLVILLVLGLGIAFSDQFANLFKYGFKRLRPCHDPELIHKMRLVTCGGQFGFYSAHASTSFFVATFLSVLLRKTQPLLPYLAFSWAVIFAYSRIYLGVHFPGDVFVGLLFGILWGSLFAYFAKKILMRLK